MSAVPRSTAVRLVAAASAQRVLEGAPGVAEPALGDPEVGQGDRAAEHVREVPGAAQTLDGGRVARCAASRSPLPQEASPERADAAATGEVVVVAARRDGPVGVHDGRRRVAVAPAPGRLDTSRSRPAGGRARPRRARPSLRRRVRPSSRSTSSSRLSTPSNSPLAISAPMKPTASTGRTRTTSCGMSSSQRRIVASCRSRAGPGSASSTRSAARSTSPAASACRTAGTGSPAASYHRPARRCRSATSSGRSVEQMRAQDVGEEVVVAVPLAAVVERDHEQVRAVEQLEHALAVAPRR